MPLKQEERALLQLVCERGQNYEDIAGLLGSTPDEVQAKARAALTEIGGADPDAEVGLTDYLLGQADPIGRADAVRHLQQDPEALALAGRIEEGLRLIAPAAKLPKLPEPRGKRRRAAAPAPGDAAESESAPAARSGEASRAPLLSRAPRFDTRQSRVIAGLIAAGVILLFAVLAIAGVFSAGGGDDNGSATESAQTDPAEAQRDITSVRLRPSADSGVAGRANFGLIGDTQLYVDLELQGLDPEPPNNQAYLFWLMVGDDAGYPVDQLQPDQNGNVSGRFPVPAPVAATIAGQANAVRVSQTSITELQDRINDAEQEQAPVLAFIGDELAAGEIPIAPGGADGGTGGGAGGGAVAPEPGGG